MTITEGGYPVDEASGDFAPPRSGALPPSFVALARAFQQRRDAGLGGLTVQSCDNVMGNGDVTKVATLGVCGVVEPGLETWVADNVTFPNSMVDRITPQTTDADRAFLSEQYGLVDRWPVVAEPFIQWVIEDDFAAGRPPYEEVGVLMTDDVRPYETLKLRILNAGHSVITYLAALAGHTYIHEIMASPPLARYLQQFHDQEATPSLPPVRGIDVSQYKRVVAERFANPEVRDQVARVCQDGTSKWPKFLVPTVESQLEQGGQVKLSALALASWCQYLLGARRFRRGARRLRPTPARGGTSVRARLSRRSRGLPRLRRRPRHSAGCRPSVRLGLHRGPCVATRGRRVRHAREVAGQRRLMTEASEPERQERGRDSGALFQAERRAQILKRVHDRGRVDVGNLAEEFGVTGETIRRDLSELQRERLVRRVHGGAVPWRGSMLVPRLAVREGHMIEEKRRIARAALAEVPERGTLIIDSGSTALHLADLLRSRS